MFIDGKSRIMPKVSKLSTEEVYNLHVSAFEYSLHCMFGALKFQLI